MIRMLVACFFIAALGANGFEAYLVWSNWAARHGLYAQIDTKVGSFGLEPACAPWQVGRIDAKGLAWCDGRSPLPAGCAAYQACAQAYLRQADHALPPWATP